MFSVTINIDEDFLAADREEADKLNLSNIKKRLNITVKFRTLEEKKKYLASENQHTYSELKEFYGAMTKSERTKARIKLYAARRQHYDFYFKQEEKQEKRNT